MIEEEESIPQDLQNLIFNGRVLNDNRLLSEYNIMYDSTLFLTFRYQERGFITINMPEG